MRVLLVGRLLAGVEARIADDGELLIRGPIVMCGYRKEPETTAEAIDADGWLSTGDIVTIDTDGDLRVVDERRRTVPTRRSIIGRSMRSRPHG